MRIIPTLILTAGLLVPVLPATAQTTAISVRHADLNLAHPAGRATLDRRIALAARQVCAVGDERMLAVKLAERRCIRSAVAGSAVAVAKLDRANAVALAQSSPARVAPGMQ